eukprot:gene5774-8621_t
MYVKNIVTAAAAPPSAAEDPRQQPPSGVLNFVVTAAAAPPSATVEPQQQLYSVVCLVMDWFYNISIVMVEWTCLKMNYIVTAAAAAPPPTATAVNVSADELAVMDLHIGMN